MVSRSKAGLTAVKYCDSRSNGICRNNDDDDVDDEEGGK